MNQEDKGDNTPEEAGNTAPEETKPNLPAEDTPIEEKATEPQDPEYVEWEAQNKELTYKRYQDSSAEAKKFQEQAEKTKKEWDDYQAQVARELQVVYQKDPEVAAKLFGMEPPEKEQEENPQIDPKEIAQQAAIEARAQIEVESFHERNKTHFKTEEDWKATQDIALSFVGKQDSEGKPYTIQTALRDATLLRNPELIGDKAISEHLTSQAIRASASESGETPRESGSDSGAELGEEYDDLASEMGIELTSEMKDRIAQRNRNQEAQ